MLGVQELFLDRPIAETIDPREDRMAKNHASFKQLLKKPRRNIKFLPSEPERSGIIFEV